MKIDPPPEYAHWDHDTPPPRYCPPQAKDMAQWFDDALISKKYHPSIETCQIITQDLKVAINRLDNDRQLRQPDPPKVIELADATIAQIITPRLVAVRNAAAELKNALAELAKYLPGEEWNNESNSIQFGKLEEILTTAPDRPVKRRPGNPGEDWHHYGKQFALAVQAALKERGCPDNLAIDHADSAVARIGALMVTDIKRRKAHWRRLHDAGRWAVNCV
jgi:hypothetical protein